MGDLLPVLARVSARLFAPPGLSSNADYQRLIMAHTVNLLGIMATLNRVPAAMRPLLGRWLPALKRYREHREEMKRLIAPHVTAAAVDTAAAALPSAPKHQPAKPKEAPRTPEDDQNLLTWMARRSPPEYAADLDYQAILQLRAALAGVSTTNMALAQALFALARHPAYVEPLRAEIAAVAAAEADAVASTTAVVADAAAADDATTVSNCEGTPRAVEVALTTRGSLDRLSKLDSFLKESQRLHPVTMFVSIRKVRQDIVLHDGTTLPRGARIGIPTCWLERPGNDMLEDNAADEFDGFRYHQLRARADAVDDAARISGGRGGDVGDVGDGGRSGTTHLFASNAGDALQFGLGRHVCPGRFLAAMELKLLLAHLIMTFDIKLPDSAGGNAAAGSKASDVILLRKKI
jgi:cytochrome P450